MVQITVRVRDTTGVYLARESVRTGLSINQIVTTILDHACLAQWRIDPGTGPGIRHTGPGMVQERNQGKDNQP